QLILDPCCQYGNRSTESRGGERGAFAQSHRAGQGGDVELIGWIIGGEICLVPKGVANAARDQERIWKRTEQKVVASRNVKGAFAEKQCCWQPGARVEDFGRIETADGGQGR